MSTCHKCPLPFGRNASSAWLPVTGLPDNTVTRCPECGADWIVRRVLGAPIPMQEWKKVRWWHFRLRSAIERIGGGDE